MQDSAEPKAPEVSSETAVGPSPYPSRSPAKRAASTATPKPNSDVEKEDPELSPPEEPVDEGDALAVAFFLTLFTMSLISIAYLFSGFWTDIVLALVFSALARGPYLRLLRAVGRPYVAATIVSLAIVVLVALPTTYLVITLSDEASTAIEITRHEVSLDRLDALLFGDGWLAERIRSFSTRSGIEITPKSIRDFIASAAGAIATVVYSGANQILANVLSGLFHFMILIAAVFYLLVDGPRFERFVFKLSPLPESHEQLLLAKFGHVGRAILFGNGIGSAIQGILGGIAMTAVGLPSPVLWGVVMTIFAFLPVVGVSVVVIPATTYLFLTGAYAEAIGFMTFCGIMALVVENVVKTRLMGSHIQMHDMLIFLSVIGGIAVFGVLGILYGPLLVTLFLTLAELYETAYKDRIRDPLAAGPPPA